MGNAGKRKEMVESRRVQQMYVEGRCVKGVYAIVCKSGVYVCDRIVHESACVCVCMCVCMCALCGHLNACAMCACVCVRVCVYELPKQKRIKQWHDKRTHASSGSRPPQ